MSTLEELKLELKTKYELEKAVAEKKLQNTDNEIAYINTQLAYHAESKIALEAEINTLNAKIFSLE